MAMAKWCKKNLDLSLVTFVDFCSYLREICTLQVHDVFREKKIGGPGNFVCWGYGKILTFVSTRFGRQGARNMLRRRLRKQVSSLQTLMREILRHIEPGSIIHTDCWKGYSTEQLHAAGFQHFTVNQKYNFVDPVSGMFNSRTKTPPWHLGKVGCHTQNFE